MINNPLRSLHKTAPLNLVVLLKKKVCIRKHTELRLLELEGKLICIYLMEMRDEFHESKNGSTILFCDEAIDTSSNLLRGKQIYVRYILTMSMK
jgi:hypothetical protein